DPLGRSRGGSFTPIRGWIHSGDHALAPLGRSRSGSIEAIANKSDFKASDRLVPHADGSSIVDGRRGLGASGANFESRGFFTGPKAIGSEVHNFQLGKQDEACYSQLGQSHG